MQHSKLASVWFPSKGYDAFCNKRSNNSVKGQYIPLISSSYQRGNPSVHRVSFKIQVDKAIAGS